MSFEFVFNAGRLAVDPGQINMKGFMSYSTILVYNLEQEVFPTYVKKHKKVMVLFVNRYVSPLFEYEVLMNRK